MGVIFIFGVQGIPWTPNYQHRRVGNAHTTQLPAHTRFPNYIITQVYTHRIRVNHLGNVQF